jgi:hemolysin activation/secretion protein
VESALKNVSDLWKLIEIEVAGVGLMFARVCRLLAALVTVGVSFAAAAQAIPPSEQPGRERQRFTEPPSPLAEPAGPRIALPSTVAPEGAEKIRLKIPAIRIEGVTVYRPEDLAVLYQDMIGREVTLTAVYDLAQRITARYGMATCCPAPSCRRRTSPRAAPRSTSR